MTPKTEQTPCALCGRHVHLTFHHLIPRKVHRRARFRKHYTKQELNRGIWICRQCHRGLHKLFDEMQLANSLNTLELLKQNSALENHVQWVAKQRETI